MAILHGWAAAGGGEAITDVGRGRVARNSAGIRVFAKASSGKSDFSEKHDAKTQNLGA
jgi:hypothetical protein